MKHILATGSNIFWDIQPQSVNECQSAVIPEHPSRRHEVVFCGERMTFEKAAQSYSQARAEMVCFKSFILAMKSGRSLSQCAEIDEAMTNHLNRAAEIANCMPEINDAKPEITTDGYSIILSGHPVVLMERQAMAAASLICDAERDFYKLSKFWRR